MKKTMKEGKLEARCDIELKEQLEIAAKKMKVKPAALIRRFVYAGLNDQGGVIDVQPLVTGLNVISRDMGKIGGNLNQIAHHFNIKQELSESKLALALKAIQQQQSNLGKLLKILKYQLYKRG